MTRLWDTSSIKPCLDIVMAGETIPAMFWNAVAKRGPSIWMRQKHLGLWRSWTWNQTADAVREIAGGLMSLGFARGDCASILSNTVVEWVWADLAVLSCGGVSNGVYPTDAASQLQFLCEDSRTTLLFVEDDEQLDKALEVRAQLPLLRKIVVFDMDGLRELKDPGVISMDALRALGTGFLSHPANTSLRASLIGQEDALVLSKQAFFEELLRLVYRLIFLATVEDRIDASTGHSLVFSPDASEVARARYKAGYSISWLRDRAVRRSSFDTHSDLWQALSITFDGLAIGQSALGLPALGGLYASDQCPNLATSQIENRHLLAAIFELGFFRQTTGLTRVNYRDMGAEELGSVYESLLELVPEIQNLTQFHSAKFKFIGEDDETTNRGNARKLSGSFYTPDALVQAESTQHLLL